MSDENNGNILDLDAFVPDDKEVIIKGKSYKIDGSASVKTTLALLKAVLKREKTPADSIEELTKSIEDLMSRIEVFFIDPIEREVLEGLDVTGQLPKLIAFLYGRKVTKEDAKEDAEKNASSQSQ